MELKLRDEGGEIHGMDGENRVCEIRFEHFSERGEKLVLAILHALDNIARRERGRLRPE